MNKSQLPNISLDEIVKKQIINYPNRPTIIFLHDSLGCIELWRDFPKKLGELTRCNVLIYDRQGYGQSCAFTYDKRDNYYMELEADILNELLEYWNIKEAILFGHSDGGSIALIMAGKYSEKIKGIITEGAHVFVEDVTIKGIKEAAELYKTSNLKTKLEKYHGDKTAAMFKAWSETWLSDEFSNWNIEHFLPKVICLSLIIQGEDDEYGTFKQVEAISQQTNDKSIKLILSDVKHTPHKEAPEQVLKATSTFINNLLTK